MLTMDDKTPMNEQGGADVGGTTLRTPNDDRDNERAAWWGESPDNRRATHHRGRHRANEVSGITTTPNNRGRPIADILEGRKKKKIPQSPISDDSQEITDNVPL